MALARLLKLQTVGLVVILALAPTTGQPGGIIGGGPPEDGPPPDSTPGDEGAPSPPEQGGGPSSTTSSASVEVTELCDSEGASADYSEVLIGAGETMQRNTASRTGCPNHVNWNINPNPAREISSNTTIPAYPVFIENDGTANLNEAPGAVGILFNGVSAFSSWARGTADSYENSAFYAEADTFDLCGGHATAEGWYHYHNTAGCLQEQAIATAGLSPLDHSPQLGWAYDGFPIYGQLGPDGIEMKLCGQEGADDIHCLDLCSGYEAELPDTDGFKYRYYTSCGFDESFFPFTTNCYRGCCPEGMECAGFVEACEVTSPEPGYGDGYIPAAGLSLAEPYDAELIVGADSYFIGSDSSLDCSLYLGEESHTEAPTPAPRSFFGSAFPTGFSVTPSPEMSLAPTSSPSAMPTSSPTGLTRGAAAMPVSSGPEESGVNDESETNAAIAFIGNHHEWAPSTTMLLVSVAVTTAAIVATHAVLVLT